MTPRDKARVHARRSHRCWCGKVVWGNGGNASHRAMHERRGERPAPSPAATRPIVARRIPRSPLDIAAEEADYRAIVKHDAEEDPDA